MCKRYSFLTITQQAICCQAFESKSFQNIKNMIFVVFLPQIGDVHFFNIRGFSIFYFIFLRSLKALWSVTMLQEFNCLTIKRAVNNEPSTSYRKSASLILNLDVFHNIFWHRRQNVGFKLTSDVAWRRIIGYHYDLTRTRPCLTHSEELRSHPYQLGEMTCINSKNLMK